MTDAVQPETAQKILAAVSQCMARHAVMRLQPMEGQEAIVMNTPALGPSTNALHLIWAHPSDQATMLQLAGKPGEQAPMKEQDFFTDLVQTLQPLGASGLRFLPGGFMEFRPIEGTGGKLAFLFNDVRVVRG